MAAFGFVAADRWIASARAGGTETDVDGRLVLVVVSTFAALAVLAAAPTG